MKVLKFDRERNRVSLGLKQLGDDPWMDLIRRYPENTRIFGKVTNIADYGCFVEIEEGVEGLVHVSDCLLYTSPSPRDKRQSRMPSSA